MMPTTLGGERHVTTDPGSGDWVISPRLQRRVTLVELEVALAIGLSSHRGLTPASQTPCRAPRRRRGHERTWTQIATETLGSGEPAGIRTQDRRIKSPLLYH
jgi:hypothetical protein